MIKINLKKDNYRTQIIGILKAKDQIKMNLLLKQRYIQNQYSHLNKYCLSNERPQKKRDR